MRYRTRDLLAAMVCTACGTTFGVQWYYDNPEDGPVGAIIAGWVAAHVAAAVCVWAYYAYAELTREDDEL